MQYPNIFKIVTKIKKSTNLQTIPSIYQNQNYPISKKKNEAKNQRNHS